MRAASLLAVTFLLSTHLPAQQNQTVVLVAPPASDSCPVGFSAARNSVPELSLAKDGKRITHGAGLEVSFSPKDAPRLMKVGLIVHGTSLSTGPMYLPVSVSAPANITESVQIERDSPDGLLKKSFLTAKMGNIAWVELTRIDYADGTAWNASEGSRCRATPNGFLLVDGTARAR